MSSCPILRAPWRCHSVEWRLLSLLCGYEAHESTQNGMSDAEQRYLRISVTNKWNTMNMSLESHFYLKCTSRTGFSPCLRPETELDSSCSKGFLLRPTCVYHRRAVTVIASPCFKIRFWERTMLIIIQL